MFFGRANDSYQQKLMRNALKSAKFGFGSLGTEHKRILLAGIIEKTAARRAGPAGRLKRGAGFMALEKPGTGYFLSAINPAQHLLQHHFAARAGLFGLQHQVVQAGR